ncbi:MAG TPA: AraC family transcriptional regulator [Thermoanaerobaculia bacterium]|nr:AraC family transcriptional regulator [Thermoanaerobaculia bacterium]
MQTFQVDSPLGRWTHSEWHLPQLAGIVDMMWHFDGMTTSRRERVFPNGLLEIIIHLGDRYSDASGICPETCISGLQSSSFAIEAPPRPTCVLGIRLHPVGAFALLRRPLHELTGLSVDLRDIVAVDELVESCQNAMTAAERFRVCAAWIARRVNAVDPAMHWITGEITRSGGTASIADLRARSGFTKTRLANTFREQVGVTPKIFARIVRFRRVLEMINVGTAPLADLALAAGYYDQPHMNAEFRELSGLAPSEFLAARRFERSVSVAE